MLMNTNYAPSLSLNFNHKYLNGNYKIIDLSWYLPYKTFGDTIICGFVYLGFIWTTFKYAHSLISGDSSISSNVTDVDVKGKGG